MDILAAPDVKRLIQNRQPPCVSIYMSTNPPGTSGGEDQIRYRNLLSRAQLMLDQTHVHKTRAREMLGRMNSLLLDGGFWRSVDHGLAIFSGPDMFEHYRLPQSFKELVTVAARFHVKPLLPLLTGDERFLVLAISQNDLRLLDCTRDTCHRLPLPADMPRSLAKALEGQGLEESLQLHTRISPAGPGAKRVPMYYGNASGGDAVIKKARILQFFLIVERHLRKLLAGRTEPMVTAAVEYLHPIYRQANSYSHLLDQGIDGNPDKISDADLHRAAWEIIRPRLERGTQDALHAFDRAGKANCASLDLPRIVSAAESGMVDWLLLDRDAYSWGRYDPLIHELVRHDRQMAGDDDLLDLAAAHTFMHRGSVRVLETDRMPLRAPVAAVLRPVAAIMATQPPYRAAG